MTTRASFNGTSAAEMEFEAAHYSNPEMEEEWESPEGHPYSNPYSNPEMEEEWESPEGHPYSNPYSNPEMEEEWESPEGHPYSNPYSNPEFEDEAGLLMPLITRMAKAALPQAKRIAMGVGSNLLSQLGQGQAGSQPAHSHRSRQIAALFHRLGRLFAQAESETATQEAHLFGTNEYETEVAAHEIAQEAALTEVMAAEASHTESESEAQALLGAALPISMRVMGGRIGIRRLTPALLRVNAQLVLNLHRQGAPGRQLLRVMPSVQRRTVSTLGAMQRSGQPVTPAVAANVM